MTDRSTFVAARQERWAELEELAGRRPRHPEEVRALADLYRSVSADLSAAQAAELPDDVIAYLDQLAGRAHNQLYAGRQVRELPVRWVLDVFPCAIRRNIGFFALSNLLFYGPFLLAWGACFWDPSLAERVLPASQLEMMEAMYAEPTGRGGSGEDATMAGFYVYNNIGIALRCFATGAFAGLGSLFFLIYNGAVLGTTFGYVSAGPGAVHLLTFASGHGSWELTGIVVSGTAGLRLGWALAVPGRRTLAASLAEAREDLIGLVAGAVALLAVAAAIEGFWSASPLPDPVKWVFAVGQVPVLAAWLVFGGRR